MDTTWSGGCVGLYRDTGLTTDLVWDNFQCGYDGNSDGDLLDAGDRVYADYNFDGSWNTISLSYDFNGNLIADGLFKHKYDAWNRLVGAWYHNGDMTAADERAITYEYDGLRRRIEKVVANKGWGTALAGGGDEAMVNLRVAACGAASVQINCSSGGHDCDICEFRIGL